MGGPLPEGVERRVRWKGHLRLSDSSLAMLASVYEDCRTLDACEALSVVPTVYEDGSMGSGAVGTPSGCVGEDCPEPQPEAEGPYVNGSRSSEWLVPIDLSDPTDPRVGDPIAGGRPDEFSEEFCRYGVEPWLLGGGNMDVFAYPSVEQLYDANGNTLLNEHGHPIERHYVQFFEASAEALGFGNTVSVLGHALLLGPAAWAGDDEAEHSVFTLSGAYDETGADSDPFEELLRLSIRDGGAYVTERLALPRRAYDAVGRGSRIVLLGAPLDYCADGAQFELMLVDASAEELSLSEPLMLDYDGWAWHIADWAPQPEDKDTLHLFGGPAQNNGRAVVDVSGDVPEVVAYETFEW
jgi:hypothetical protein